MLFSEDSETPLWLYALVMIPFSAIVGVSASTIAASAWNLIVPLVYVGFGFSVWESILCSVLMDMFNGISLTIFYSFHDQVDFRYGFFYGLIAVIVACIISHFTQNWIAEHEDKLRGAVAFFPLILAVFFSIKAFLVWRKNRKLQQEQLQKTIEEAQIEQQQQQPSIEDSLLNDSSNNNNNINNIDINNNNNHHHHQHQKISPETRIESGDLAFIESSTDRLMKKINYSKNIESEQLIGNSNYEQSSTGLINSQSNDNIYNKEQQLQQQQQQEGQESESAKPTLFSKCPNFIQSFINASPILQPHAKSPYLIPKMLFTCLSMSFVGGWCGLLYVGGGIIFSCGIVVWWYNKPQMAAGTGCLMMSMVMSALSLQFLQRDIRSDAIFAHILLSTPFSMLAAVIGARFAMKVSELTIYLVVTVVLIILAITTIVQTSLLD
eukprot:TRINITY_DN93_c0_g1_i1.p1 TRINITY_DN93_c0_g1~~TRINITY_DN93_c0_g1_i1.p1  ORF type:complete len:437 (-),score=205.83 TRINITY_DN93_c0_g1_i1:76-1386(-)